MSGYLPKITHTGEFEDDDYTAVLKPLTRDSFLSVMPVVMKMTSSNKLAKDIGLEDLMKDPKRITDMYTIAAESVAVHLESITGIRDAKGNAVAKESIQSDVYFIELVIGLFSVLIEAASLGKKTKPGSAAR